MHDMFEWALYIITRGGYTGIFLLMVLDNAIPLLPSELVLPLVGFAAAKGSANIVAVAFVVTCGTVVGYLPWYFLGYALGSMRLKRVSARYGRLLTLRAHDIDRTHAWFMRHGQKTVLLGRLVPTVRTLISVPAGIARMPLPSFLAYSFIGSTIWTIALMSVGYLLQSQYGSVAGYMYLVSRGILLLLALVYVYRVITFGNK